MRNVLKTHSIEIMLVDFTKDKDEPAYDVEVWIDDIPTLGGGKKQVFSTHMRPRGSALKAAQARVRELLITIQELGKE